VKFTGKLEIELWSDSRQTRSFCHIDDCVTEVHRLTRSDYMEALNPGQGRLVTIDELADMVSGIARISIAKRHVPGPQGVRGRNSDNTRLGEDLRWAPEVSLEEGLRQTYLWIEEKMGDLHGLRSPSIGTAAK
jgi:GDP-D-mannose 3', 5'-epimerase